MRELISLTEAEEVLLSNTVFMEKNKINLNESLGAVLAESVVAKENIPPFNRSPLDGYAILDSDSNSASKDNPVTLEIIDEAPAGFVASKKIVSGTAIKVTTGAQIPEGATAIVKFEDTEFTDKKVDIFQHYDKWSNIAFAGEDVSQGETILPKGQIITPEVIGMLAALGIWEVATFKKPRVGLFSTGDELIDVNDNLRPGKIRNSNLYALAAEIEKMGAEPIAFGIVPDSLEKTTLVIEEALEKCDLIISTGGVSVGDYDVVKDAMTSAGMELLFWRVNLKPGTPAVAGKKDGKIMIGLSGNPAAALITFELLARPLILKSMGVKNIQRPRLKAEMLDSFQKSSKQMRFLRGYTTLQDGKPVVSLTGRQSPGVMKSILYSNSLIVVEAGAKPLVPGDEVTVILTKEMGDKIDSNCFDCREI